jgi:hypothetical protein
LKSDQRTRLEDFFALSGVAGLGCHSEGVATTPSSVLGWEIASSLRSSQ